MTLPTVAFIGLGNMGFPMAGHLSQKGYDVTVFNRTKSKAEQWLSLYKGSIAHSPADAAANADMVFTCVGNDNDLTAVLLGEHGVIHSIKSGSVIIDHSTVSADISKTIAKRCKDIGVDFVDAPVSGGQQGAQNAQLSIMCGAEPAIFEHVAPVLQTYAKALSLMGPVGSGQLTKMVNQICVGGLLQALAEGINFAEKAGLNAELVMQVIGNGAASSWQMINRHQTMLEGQYEHGFAVDWMRKDFAICLAEAEKLNAPLPVTSLVDHFYRDIQEMGGGRWDTSSLLARLKSESN